MFRFGQDIGIDLGTATVLGYVKGKGIVLKEPCVVAVNSNTNEVLAVGSDARRMIGRTPGNIVATRPLKDGVISNYTVTEKMLKTFISKICNKTFFAPRIMICIPSQVTEVEKRAVIDAASQAGARKVYLIDEAIIKYIKKKHNIMVGERTAEEIKLNIGCVYPKIQDQQMEIRGRDLVTGLPKTITIYSSEIMEALREPAQAIIEAIYSVLEKTPPELAADISDMGIYLTGGGCLIDGLDKLIQESTGLNVTIPEDAVSCVALGTGKALNNLDVLENKKLI